jgi:hypothetical protein
MYKRPRVLVLRSDLLLRNQLKKDKLFYKKNFVTLIKFFLIATCIVMESIKSVATQFNSAVMGPLGYLDNEYVSAVLFLILILYAGLIVPALPAKVIKLFDNIFVKFIFFFLIIHLYEKNPAVAVLLAAILLIVVTAIGDLRMSEKFGNSLNGYLLSDVFPEP